MDSSSIRRYLSGQTNRSIARAGGLALAGSLLLAACTSSEPEPLSPEARLSPTAQTRAASPSERASQPPSKDGGPAKKETDDGGSGGRVRDPAKRRTVTGRAPTYVEIESARLRDTGARLALSLSLAGPIPERMPDDRSELRVTFALTNKSGQRYSVIAQATEGGWEGFISGTKDPGAPDKLLISPQQIRILVGWDRLGGRQPLRWNANVTWTRPPNTAFDIVPERGYASFP
jgi:hypothetical protein